MREIRRLWPEKSIVKSLVLLAGLLYGLETLAQPTARFTWSAYQKTDKYSQAVYIFKYEQGYGAVVKTDVRFRHKYADFEASVYDKDLQKVKSRSWRMNKNLETILNIWQNGEMIYCLTQVDLPNQRVALRLRSIPFLDASLPMDQKEIVVLNLSHYRQKMTFYAYKKDSSVRIWYTNAIEERNAKQVVTHLKFSLDMNLRDKALLELGANAELCKVYKVDEVEGDQFMVYAKEYKVRAEEQRGFSPNYTFTFYLVDPNRQSFKSLSLDNRETYLERGRFRYEKGVLEATGFFTEKIYAYKSGIWWFKYDFKTDSLHSDTAIYFGQDVKNLPNNGFRMSIFRSSLMELFYLDYFVKLNNNRRMLVAEQYTILPASVGSAYTYNRFYGDILLISTESDGSIYEAKRLIKAQETFNNFGEFSSYAVTRHDTAFYFYFNDHIKNKNQEFEKHLVWSKRSKLEMLKVNPSNTESFTLGTYADLGGIIQVRDMLDLGNETFLVYARKKKKSKLGVMHVENLGPEKKP